MIARFNDGVTTYDLSASGVILEAYTPLVGERGVATVKDTLMIMITGSSVANQQEIKDDINLWLATAREQQESVNESRIYLQIKQNSDSEWRRSEMVGGKLQPDRGALDMHSQLKQRYVLTVERKNWWEWDEEELPLSVDNVTFATGGASYANDGAPVFIRSIDVTGDPMTPIPVRLELTQDTGSNNFKIFRVAHNVFGTIDPLLDEHVLEGEDSGISGTVTVDANSRGGNYKLKSWVGAFDAAAYRWTINSALITAFGGRWYRLVARLATLPTGDIYIHARLRHDDVTDNYLRATEETLVNADSMPLVDLGVIQVPPNGVIYPARDLVFDVRVRAAATDSLGLDCLWLLPTDSYYEAAVASYPFVMDGVVFDGRLGVSYCVRSGENFMDISDYPPHVGLWAQHDQWLTILHTFTSDMDIDEGWTVRAYYRPRRVTV